METTTVEPGNDPMHEQNEREDPQRERRLLAARPHAFAQEVRIERRERNDHDGGQDCEIGPKSWDGDRTGRCEQCDGSADHEQACLEVSRDGHPLVYHFKGSEMPSCFTLKANIAVSLGMSASGQWRDMARLIRLLRRRERVTSARPKRWL